MDLCVCVGVVFRGTFLSTDSVSSVITGLFRFSMFWWNTFDKTCFSMKLPISCIFKCVLTCCLSYSLILFSIHTLSSTILIFSLLILFICHFYPSWSIFSVLSIFDLKKFLLVLFLHFLFPLFLFFYLFPSLSITMGLFCCSFSNFFCCTFCSVILSLFSDACIWVHKFLSLAIPHNFWYKVFSLSFS